VTTTSSDSELPPIRTTGIGSWPGTDMMDAIKIAFAECPDLPYLPELPARGPYAQLIGRSTAFLAGLAVDLQPAGWRLTDASSREHRLAISTLRSDLDKLEEHAQGFEGTVKLSVAGPWTLAAMMERPRGDRVLADSGARRDLGQSLAEGIAQLVAELIRRLPDVELLVQLDEPMLPSVLGGTIANASGLSRHRAIEPSEVSGVIIQTRERLAPTPVAVHCCATDPPIELLRLAGVAGVLLDIDQLSSLDWDAIAVTLEAGQWIGMGALPTDRTPTSDRLSPDQVARRVLGPLRDLGLEPPVAASIMITPACGLASATREGAVAALRTLRSAAQILTEQLAD
jgi:methionine synthase II (cobalamin-independent)